MYDSFARNENRVSVLATPPVFYEFEWFTKNNLFTVDRGGQVLLHLSVISVLSGC